MKNRNQLSRTPRSARSRRRGLLTLEWILLITVLVIGTLGGLAAVRNVVFKKVAGLGNCVENLNVKTELEMDLEGMP